MLHNTYYSWTTGGGFAAYVSQPQYQQAAVSAYLQSGAEFPHDTAFNRSHRMYPDISYVLAPSRRFCSCSHATQRIWVAYSRCRGRPDWH